MNRKLRKTRVTLVQLMALALALAAGSWAPGAWAQDPLPHERPDESWISINGEIQAVDTDSFILDYGEGMITVEMDDKDRDADAYALLKGDKVQVTGRIDDDFFETTTIEAVSVFVENLNTTFFASGKDERTTELLDVGYGAPLEVAETTLHGTVTRIGDREFTLDTDTRTVIVETLTMPYNPLDDEGYQKISVGDRVRVVGQTDLDFFNGREFDAQSVVKMHRGPS